MGFLFVLALLYVIGNNCTTLMEYDGDSRSPSDFYTLDLPFYTFATLRDIPPDPITTYFNNTRIVDLMLDLAIFGKLPHNFSTHIQLNSPQGVEYFKKTIYTY